MESPTFHRPGGPRRYKTTPSEPKFKTPPRIRFASRSSPIRPPAPVHRRSPAFKRLAFSPPSSVRSPKRKRPRTGQLRPATKPQPPRRASAILPPPTVPSSPPDQPDPYSGLDAESGFSQDFADDWTLELTLSQIEQRQMEVMPQYLECLLANPACLAQISNSCFIVQDWDFRAQCLKVISLKPGLIDSMESSNMCSKL